MLVPVILAGGSGKRLTPLSTAEKPKPFWDLLDEGQSLFQGSIKRANLVTSTPPLVVCSQLHQHLIETQLSEIQCNAQLILEPHQRNTAPAIACVAEYVKTKYGEQTQLLVMPADHYIDDINYFVNKIQEAQSLCRNSDIVVFGVSPSFASTDYGYIQHDIKQRFLSFKEKPDQTTANSFIKSGNYLWNSGFFLADTATISHAMEQYAPIIQKIANQSVQQATYLSNQSILLHRDFAHSPSISFDHAVLELCPNIVLSIYSSGWNDLGTWSALYHHWPKTGDKKAYHHSLGLSLTPLEQGFHLYQEGRLLAHV